MIHVAPLSTEEAGVRASLPSALYVSSNMKYQQAYKQDWTYEDLSFGLHDSTSGALLAYVCLTAGQNAQGQRELSYYGLPACGVVLGESSATLSHALERALQGVVKRHGPCALMYRESSGACGLSAAAQFFLRAGASCAPAFTCVLDLTRETLWTGIRKRYKPLIHKGQRLFTHRLITVANVDADFFAQFKALHVRVSGRQTRSDLSWQRQLEAVRQGEAFAVASSMDGRLCGASYYITNGVSCYYGVGAYDRDLFEILPVSHAALWTAIEHARSTGCVRFEVGQTYFPFQDGDISEKKKNIGMFKRGFGGDVFPILTLRGDIHGA